jgi:hypothetical protein
MKYTNPLASSLPRMGRSTYYRQTLVPSRKCALCSVHTFTWLPTVGDRTRWPPGKSADLTFTVCVNHLIAMLYHVKHPLLHSHTGEPSEHGSDQHKQ